MTERSTARPEPAAWEALERAAVLDAQRAQPGGLTDEEAKARLATHGPNRLPEREVPPAWRIVARQFRSPLIYLLVAAGLVALALGYRVDAAFIAAVLLINAAIGAYQETRAERGAHALQKMLRTRAVVLRGGHALEVDADTLVPGDVVSLESGARVPADLRLLSASGLEVDESLLTGESVSVSKDASWVATTRVPLGDRRNMLHAGAFVVRGRCEGVVVATGLASEVGQIARAANASGEGRPPLLVRMDRFSRVVGVGIVGAVLLVGAIAIVNGYPIEQVVFVCVALVVSAIPEGLPVALTIALSVGAARMAKRNVVVRRLAAVEGLGSCTLIASDKTGTLTANEITVRELWLADGARAAVSGEGFAPSGCIALDGVPLGAGDHAGLDRLVRAGALCNEAGLHQNDGAWAWHGDPTDVALLTLGAKHGFEREVAIAAEPEIARIPFEAERRYAASFHRSGDGAARVYVKGAPERVLTMCTSPHDHERALSVAREMASRGQRVLAVAAAEVAMPDPTQATPQPAGLTLLGLVGMIDPLRAGVREAVAACRSAGIRVCMVTGDHPETALAIGRDLGIATSNAEVVTGAVLEAASEAEMLEHVRRASVFARTAPAHKLRIVEAAQRLGHFVAVTGDGVNDAPALRAANIGVAMGRGGTDVAREAADLVLTDDNFASIVGGVREGRIAYTNVRKVIFLLVSTGLAEILMMLLAVATKSPLPLLPAQLLWLNLVTNGLQDVALATEPAEGRELERAPRKPGERIFDRVMVERTVVSAAVMAGTVFAASQWMLRAGWSDAAMRNGVLLLMVFFENLHVGNSRSETASAFAISPAKNRFLVTSTLAAQLVHIGAMWFPPTQRALRVAPVSLATYVALFALSLGVVAASEAHKRLLRGRAQRPKPVDATDR